jgi:hypothetical protein
MLEQHRSFRRIGSLPRSLLTFSKKMAFQKSGGVCQLGLKVNGSSWNEKFVCPSLTILLQAPHYNIFCRNGGLLLQLLLYPQVNVLLLAVPWLFRGGLLLWKGCGSNRNSNDIEGFNNSTTLVCGKAISHITAPTITICS